MDFEFNDQQQMFRDTFRSFLEDNYDLARHVATVDSDCFDTKLWRQLADLGFFGMLVPGSFGGLGLGWVDVALVIEELGKALIGSPVYETLIAADLISRYGSEAQKGQWLARIASGDVRIVTAASEPESGFGIETLAAQAAPTREGWQLDGTKILVPEPRAADLVLVAARFGAEGQPGLAIVESGRPAIEVRDHRTIDPTCRMGQITYTAVPLRAEDRLGGPSGAAGCVERLLDLSSMAAALQMIGIAGKVLDLSVSYASQRVQFGRPIGSFQAIKHKCADMAVAIDAGRSAAYFAAWAAAESPVDCSRAASMAKSFCGDVARMVCNEGIQIHGGMGFTWELGLHFYLRRTKLLEFSHGDAAFHRERVLQATLAGLIPERQSARGQPKHELK